MMRQVRVHLDDVVCACLDGARESNGVCSAEPQLLAALNQFDAAGVFRGQRARSIFRAVGGSIIHEDESHIRNVQCEQAASQFRQVLRLVVRRYDYRYHGDSPLGRVAYWTADSLALQIIRCVSPR